MKIEFFQKKTSKKKQKDFKKQSFWKHHELKHLSNDRKNKNNVSTGEGTCFVIS